MKETLVHAKDMKLTYIHALENAQRKRTWEWLDKKKGVDIPPIVAVMDPSSGQLYVYNGNIRVSHALQNDYPLDAKIIYDQDDLNDLFVSNEYAWFGISDFSELVDFMKIYARYPEETCKMPDDLERRVSGKYVQWQEHNRQEMARAFGWYDD
ncbi:MAG: hypothetical protein ABIJ21_01760 [Nanoarchaeota archaeon]